MGKRKNRLRKLRKENHQSLKDISIALSKDGFKISPDAISKYERGEREPKLETWQKISKFFDVSVPYLQGLINDDNSSLFSIVKNVENTINKDINWDEIEKQSNHDKTDILTEIAFLKDKELITDNDDLNNQIDLAIKYLIIEENKTDYSYLFKLEKSIWEISNKNYYHFWDVTRSNNHETAKLKSGKNYSLYSKIDDVLVEAMTKLDFISNELNKDNQ